MELFGIRTTVFMDGIEISVFTQMPETQKYAQ
jgi:hypothetical protein